MDVGIVAMAVMRVVLAQTEEDLRVANRHLRRRYCSGGRSSERETRLINIHPARYFLTAATPEAHKQNREGIGPGGPAGEQPQVWVSQLISQFLGMSADKKVLLHN